MRASHADDLSLGSSEIFRQPYITLTIIAVLIIIHESVISGAHGLHLLLQLDVQLH